SARQGTPGQAGPRGGTDRLGAAMLVAAVAVTPAGLSQALPAFSQPVLLLAGAGVGVCSSVIPYVTDQLAMARLPRATFALMLALLPMFATVIGAIVLHQLPTGPDLAGIALVVAGVALHQSERGHGRRARPGGERGRAGAGRERAGTERERAGTERERPGTERERPGIGRDRPGVERDRPGVERDRPGVEPDRPGVEPDRPGVEPDRPGVEPDRPGVEP